MKKYRFDLAFADIIGGIELWPLWMRLAFKDVSGRYARTAIGPFWHALNVAFFVGGLGFAFAKLWNVPIKEYLPFLCAGVMAWTFLVTLVTEGSTIFLGNTGTIRQIKLPYSVYIYQMILRNIIIYFHIMPVFLALGIWAGIPLTWNLLTLVPGLIIYSANALWISLAFGLICARYRDIEKLIGNLLTVVFFLTPIHWYPHQMTGRRTFIVDFNPFYHFLELLRAPLLGHHAGMVSWIVAVGITVLGCALAVILYARFRWRIAYWL